MTDVPTIQPKSTTQIYFEEWLVKIIPHNFTLVEPQIRAAIQEMESARKANAQLSEVNAQLSEVNAQLSKPVSRWKALFAPHRYIGGRDNPYMLRWFLLPRNPYFNIYLHHVLRSDEDRALHDHPWPSLSFVLRGPLGERYRAADGTEVYRVLRTGRPVWRHASFTHRLVIINGTRGAWTLFITGPKIREWGFHCPKGWVHWRAFTAGEHGETVGKGCEE